MRLLNSCVVPIFTYGSESSTLTKHTENRLDACEKLIAGSEELCGLRIKTWSQTKRPDRGNKYQMSNSITHMRLKWLGRVLRMKDNRLTKSVHQWNPTRKRSRGRTNKSWMDCIEEDLRRAGVIKCGKTAGRQRMTLIDIAADRQEWRNLTAASMADISAGRWLPDLTAILQWLLQLHN